MCLLLGVGMAHAQTVERTGDTVNAIRGLQLGNLVYDVEFFRQSGEATYGFDEVFGATFDFGTATGALDAVLAVNDILTAEGVSTVGAPGRPPSSEFNIGYETVTEGPGVEDFTLVIVQLGSADPDSPGAWLTGNKSYPISENHTWADFTIVGFAGDGNLSPLADANGQYTGFVDEEVVFDSTGSTDLDGMLDSYEWDFGDGDTDTNNTGSPVSHTYTAPGAYFVILTVTDDNVPGAPDSDRTIAFISASEPPVADPNGPYTGRLGTPVSFDGTGSSDPDGTIVQYDWDFGDGNTAIDGGSTPSHTYHDTPWEYDVTLKVTDDSGEFVSATTTATIGIGNLPPVAEAGVTAFNDTMTRNFDGSASVDPNVGGAIVDWSWDFGDGAFGSGETTSHTYTSFGNFNVTLTVTDNEGKTDSDNTLAIIEAAPMTTTTTTMPVGGCGDPASDGVVTVSDALVVLAASEGLLICELCVCDVNDSGSVTSTDALVTLNKAMGLPASLLCPPCS